MPMERVYNRCMYDDAECMSTVIKRSLAVFLLVYVGSMGSLVDFLIWMLMGFLLLLGRLLFMVDMDWHFYSLHRFLMDMNWLLMSLDVMNFYSGLTLFGLAGAYFLMDELDLLRD